MMTAQPHLQLADGSATYVGEGVFVLVQPDETGAVQSVVITRRDLLRLLEAEG